MAYRELELTLLSAQDLKNVNLITRMDVYAVVSISGDPLTRQCTEPDTYGGRNPCWDATLRFAVPPTAAAAAGASLHVLLRAERFLGDRDVGEVVIPLSDVLASATGAGPQPPQVASYQVRKVHRWEPRGVLNVSYRLGPVVAPVVERAPEKLVYAPVTVPPQPYHHRHPPVRVVAEQDEAAQKPVMAYPAGVPQQQASHPPAKPDAYRPPPSPPPPRPAPAPPPRNGGRSNGLGQAGPTQVYMGPNSQIIFGGGGPTTAAGPPTRNSPVAAPAPSHRLAAASPFSSRGSSFSSPLSPYSSARPSPSSSAHSSTRSPYPSAAEVTHGTNNTFRNTSSHGAAISSPLPSSSPLVPNHSSVVPSLWTHPSETQHEHEQLHLRSPLAPATSPPAAGS